MSNETDPKLLLMRVAEFNSGAEAVAALQAALDAARCEEREACAQLCEREFHQWRQEMYAAEERHSGGRAGRLAAKSYAAERLTHLIRARLGQRS